MSNELTKTFFDTFGIEPKKQCFNEDCIAKDEVGYDNKICDDRCVYIDKDYPQITDRILLALICIAHTSPVITFCSRNVVNLKDEVLNVLCNWVDKHNIKQQVQELFKECE